MRKALILIFAVFVLITTQVTALAAIPPIDICQSNLNGQEYLEKTYELSPGEDPNSVIEEPFTRDGFVFNLETIRFEEVKESLTKDTQQTVTMITQTDDQGEILKKFTGSMTYTDEEGYTGTLYIETGSIFTEAESYETKRYTLTDTKEYFSMMMNDPYGIPQSTVKNGAALQLKDISWVVTGTSLAGDSLVPTEYKAVATYSGSYSKIVPTGYVTTAIYKGQLSLEVVEKLLVKVTYSGTPAVKSASERGIRPVLFILLFGALILGGTAAAIRFLRKPQVEISCFDDGDYMPVAKEPFDPRRPVIDLNGLKDRLTSTELAFSIDTKTAAGLRSGRIAILLDGEVLQHIVDLTSSEGAVYTFYIDFGGTK